MAIDYTRKSTPKPEETPAPPSGGGVNYSKAPSTPPAPAPSGDAPPATGKVVLTKSSPSVSLTKQRSAGGVMRVNLNWDQKGSKGGFFSKRSAVDLDLGCLWEFTDGRKSAVQALGGTFTSPGGNQPAIRLDGDDRSGTSTGGENLFIDLDQAHLIKRVLIYAFIYEGVPNWADSQGVITVFPASGPQVEVRLDESDPSSRFCAIAMLENVNGEITFRREVRYIQGGQREMDEAYGWGLAWSAGRK